MSRRLIGWSAILVAVVALGFSTSILGLAPTAVSTPATVISEVRTTNVRDNTFVVSWVTDQAATGEVHYGTDPASLAETASDDRGAATSDDTHYVTIQDLLPDTTYYFDVISDGTTDDNGGAHYTVTTGPVLSPPASDTIYGQVFKADGTTLAEGAIVYITLRDTDGSDSSGEAAPLSWLVDDAGYWHVSLGNARVSDLSSYFSYSASGDEVELVAQGAADGTARQTVNTDNDFPAPDMVLVLEADLSIAKTDAPDPVNASSTLTYTLTVSNAGPSAATGVTVTDTLPSGVTFTNATGTDWTCTHASGTVTCDRANLNAGTTSEITITVTAPSSEGSITNQAEVSANTADPDSGDNTASSSTTVATPATCPDYNSQPGVVDVGDLQYLATQWGQPPPPPLYYDCDDDGEITVVDLICVAKILGDSCSASAAP